MAELCLVVGMFFGIVASDCVLVIASEHLFVGTHPAISLQKLLRRQPVQINPKVPFGIQSEGPEQDDEKDAAALVSVTRTSKKQQRVIGQAARMFCHLLDAE
jgi:hypothetical protein